MEIQANELRIGNWVDDPMSGRVQIRLIGFDDFDSVGYSPIPLTPEILNSIKPNLSDNGYTHKWAATKRLEIQLNYSFITIVDYLHEYQNLYYALLGTELNYTP